MRIILVLIAVFAGGYLLRGRPSETGGARTVLYYVDPMHPAYKSDKPGIAPDCGMTLEPVYADNPAGVPPAITAAPAVPAGTIRLSPNGSS